MRTVVESSVIAISATVAWVRCAVVLVGALLLASCDNDDSNVNIPLPDDEPAETDVGDEDSADVDADADADLGRLDRDAAVGAALDVRADGCGPRTGFGTGAVIDERLAVTAAHVVAGASDVHTIDVEGRESAADVVLFDPDLDVALLRLDDSIGDPQGLRQPAARADESGLVVLPRWAGDALDLDIVDVRVLRSVDISTTDIYLDRDVARSGFEIDAAIEPGDSGAVVVLPGGGTGIVWASSNQRDRRAWAVDLPEAILDTAQRRAFTVAVDTGSCIR